MATIAIPARTFTVAPPPPARVSPAAEQPRCEQPPRTTHSTPAPTAPTRQPSRPATPPAQPPAQAKPVKPRFKRRGDSPALYEAYRPRHWREVCGQDAALKKLETLRTHGGLAGRAYWITGLSGTGKSTIAYLLASHLADSWGIDEYDAKQMNATRIREIEREMNNRAIGQKAGRAVILNEAHLLPKDAVGQLLTTLEAARLPRHAAWIFTTTTAAQKTIFDGKLDSFAFVSRCCKLELSPDVGLAFAQRAREIAQAEGLDGGKDEEWFLKLVVSSRFSLRETLQKIGEGAAL